MVSIGKHLPAWDEKAMAINRADVAELVDARDLKSLDGNVVWVRVPPPAPRQIIVVIQYISLELACDFVALLWNELCSDLKSSSVIIL
jgi:hypothetical protein